MNKPKFESPNLAKLAELSSGVVVEGKGNFEQIFKAYSSTTIRKVL